MIEYLVQKYGKQIIKELIDMMVIRQNFRGVDLKPLLLEYKVITRSTKTIITWYDRYKANSEIEDYRHYLTIKNGSGKVLISMNFKDSELPQIMAKLKD